VFARMLRDCSSSGSGDGGGSLGSAWRALEGRDVAKQLSDLGTKSADLSSKGSVRGQRATCNKVLRQLRLCNKGVVRGPSRFHSPTLQHCATRATACNDPYRVRSQVASHHAVASAIGGVDPIGIYFLFSVSFFRHGLCVCSVHFVHIPHLFHCI
jgi:hypothetical protein